MLKKRAITGIIGLIVLLSILYLMPGEIARIVFFLIFIVAGWEWANLINQSSLYHRIVFLITLILMMLCIHFLDFGIIDFKILFSLSLIFWMLILVSLFYYPIYISSHVGWIIGLIILVSGYFSVDWILINWGRDYFLAFLFFIWLMDCGAYFAGKKFGQLKLAIHISPNKTWEGLIGGLCLVVIFAVFLSILFDLDKLVLIPFVISLSLLSVIGDLTISMFKRNTGTKDTGNFFPGHGGVLDRLDSIISSAPLFALGLILISS